MTRFPLRHFYKCGLLLDRLFLAEFQRILANHHVVIYTFRRIFIGSLARGNTLSIIIMPLENVCALMTLANIGCPHANASSIRTIITILIFVTLCLM